MSDRVIHDIFGRPTLQIDEKTNTVTALRDCTVELSCRIFLCDAENTAEIEFIVERRKES